MRYCVLAVEDGIVCLENTDDEKISLAIDKLPSGIREGDILDYDNGEFILNTEATRERRSEIYDKYKRLFRK